MRAARRPLIHFIAIAALLLRALIPAGFMPGTSNGAPALVICTAQGAKALGAKLEHGSQHAQCPFAAAAGMAAAPAAPVVLALHAADQSVSFMAPAPAARQFASTVQARGPPSFV
jgi:hypothetical protein